jgi:hypothetical protein
LSHQKQSGVLECCNLITIATTSQFGSAFLQRNERAEPGRQSYRATYGTRDSPLLIWLRYVWSIAVMRHLQGQEDETLDTTTEAGVQMI